ncbi:MAG: helix-turn-helix transcriptional regulator [Saprospiraceae bacterium]|nr:helix-turn-helix transcriptional regulator [Saprospiraceae bacterium]
MRYLQSGEFYGETNQTIELDNIVLTDTEYTHKKVDWHYHENAYFTFILQGQIIEGNKKEVYTCSAGSLLFHNWQEPHYNIKPDVFTRGFHVELEGDWFKNLAFDIAALQGSLNISNPDVKFLFYKIFKETKGLDDVASLSIQDLLLQVFGKMTAHNTSKTYKNPPQWVAKIKAILHDEFYKTFSLENLAQSVEIHPVHLSRDFPKHFHCTLGEYIRKLRVEKSLHLLPNKALSITEIAYKCGFADQSHLNRCFKNAMQTTPLAYKKLLHG